MDEVKIEVTRIYQLIAKVKNLVDQDVITRDEARSLTRYPFKALERRRLRLKKHGYQYPKMTFAGVF
jgi:hypothetical protein